MANEPPGILLFGSVFEADPASTPFVGGDGLLPVGAARRRHRAGHRHRRGRNMAGRRAGLRQLRLGGKSRPVSFFITALALVIYLLARALRPLSHRRAPVPGPPAPHQTRRVD